MQGKSKFRSGVRSSVEYSQTPLLLNNAKFLRNNILVGDEPTQVLFTELVLGIPCLTVEQIHDQDLLGKPTPQLLRVPNSRALDLSPELLLKTGIWSLAPIEKGSAAANAIVRFASQVLGVKLDKTSLQRTADHIAARGITDIRAAIWDAVWSLTGPPLEEVKFWPQPWEQPRRWLVGDPSYRLNTLYKDQVGYAFARDNDETAARKFGVSPSKFKYLKSVNLSIPKVYATITELSRWRSLKGNPLICALKITRIWEK